MNYETLCDARLAAELLGTAGEERLASHVHCNESCRLGPDAPSQERLLRHRLAAARELLHRELKAHMIGKPVMDSPQVLRDWLRLRCASLEREVFLGVFLDNHLRLIECETLFVGTLTQTSVYPREIVKTALAHNAAALAVAHNHPSGDASPSRADEFLTQTLKSALALVDVRLIDHFVVGGDQVVSLAEHGLI